MNIKNKFIVFITLITIFIFAIININNTEKTKFYLFTSKTELAIGNLITLSFITGFTFSSVLTLISKNDLEKSLEDNFINDEKNDDFGDNNFEREFKSDRPPERDVRESQPTISVNYRFVDQDNDTYTSKRGKTVDNNLNSDDNDWLNKENDW